MDVMVLTWRVGMARSLVEGQARLWSLLNLLVGLSGGLLHN